MDAEEREIYYYLRGWAREFICVRDINRRAGGKRKFRENPEWAKPVLVRMVEKGILESDTAGHYRLKPIKTRENNSKRWVSPAIASMLKESGKDFTNVLVLDEPDDDYYLGL